MVNVKTMVRTEGSWFRSHLEQGNFSSTEILKGSGVHSATHLVGTEWIFPAGREPWA